MRVLSSLLNSFSLRMLGTVIAYHIVQRSVVNYAVNGLLNFFVKTDGDTGIKLIAGCFAIQAGYGGQTAFDCAQNFADSVFIRRACQAIASLSTAGALDKACFAELVDNLL